MREKSRDNNLTLDKEKGFLNLMLLEYVGIYAAAVIGVIIWIKV